MLLKDCSAIVTGGSRGIGASIALKLAEQGADIAIVDIIKDDVTKIILDKINQLDRKSFFIKSDTSSFDDAGDTINRIIQEFGTVDILVNNAGINRDGVIWKATEEQWDSVLNVNLKGYFNYIRHIAPYFKEQKHGRIVNITSINGMRGKFGQTNYSSSKAGVIGLTKSAARELGRYSVNVNAVAPGLVMTEMADTMPDEIKQKALDEIVLNRIGKPEEIADVVLFLCSEMSRHITGEVIKVDGGQYI